MKKLSLSILFISVIFGQYFGQNKVQYKNFDWEYIVSPNFNIYYYGDNKDLAIYTSKIAEKSIDQIGKHLRWNNNRPIKIIVYNSHNDFQQTNVVDSYMSEGVGGVTELFKNRIVIPFEGSYEQFKHVVHHELVHAAINDLAYGGNAQGLISGRIQLQIPLWANEGLAEFLSVNWDSNSEMVMRDLSIEDNLPSIQQLNYSILAYKGGQSVWRYISNKYGREKIGEIFQQMRRTQNAEKGFQNALGVDFEQLTENWHDYLKKEYWPEIAVKEKVENIGTKITDRSKSFNFYNISPSFSPDGSKIAYFSDKAGYMDLVITNSSGTKREILIRGNTTPDLEELKWLQPGISWSPDGSKIVFASKSGKEDAIIIVDVNSKDYTKIPIDLDGIFTTSWHPKEDIILFAGHYKDRSDLYIYNIQSKKLVNLTNDIFSDTNPSWSPDGSNIIFSSDRNSFLKNNSSIEKIASFQNDIFILNYISKEIVEVTKTDFNEDFPIFSSTNKIYFTSDQNGVSNIYQHELNSNKFEPITNVLTGIQQFDYNPISEKIVMSGYNKRGWDLFLLNKIETIDSEALQNANYLSNKYDDEDFEDLRFSSDNQTLQASQDYSRFVFAREYNKELSEENLTKTETVIDSLRISESYDSQKYITDFSIDYVATSASIDNLFGTRALAYFSWSDVLGDQRISLGSNLVMNFENSDIQLSYAFLKNRTNYYALLFQQANTFGLGYSLLYDYYGQLRDYGVALYAQYPFSKFSRIDYGATLRGVEYNIKQFDIYTYKTSTYYTEKLNALIPMFSYVFDNSSNTYTGPNDGLRYYFTFQASPKLGQDSISFNTYKFDIRKYFKINREYSFATRLMFGSSAGESPQKFFLGGNSQLTIFSDTQTEGQDDYGYYADRILDIENSGILEDVYFSEYVFPIRGALYRERVGKNVAIMNLEFRFPFVNYVDVGFPAPIRFGNIFGHLFLDIGAAWDNNDELSDSFIIQNKYGLSDPKSSAIIKTFGIGAKIFTPWALMRIDTAWDIYPSGGYSKPQYIISFGYDW